VAGWRRTAAVDGPLIVDDAALLLAPTLEKAPLGGVSVVGNDHVELAPIAA
jgi:hypothetical protein